MPCKAGSGKQFGGRPALPCFAGGAFYLLVVRRDLGQSQRERAVGVPRLLWGSGREPQGPRLGASWASGREQRGSGRICSVHSALRLPCALRRFSRLCGRLRGPRAPPSATPGVPPRPAPGFVRLGQGGQGRWRRSGVRGRGGWGGRGRGLRSRWDSQLWAARRSPLLIWLLPFVPPGGRESQVSWLLPLMGSVGPPAGFARGLACSGQAVYLSGTQQWLCASSPPPAPDSGPSLLRSVPPELCP